MPLRRVLLVVLAISVPVVGLCCAIWPVQAQRCSPTPSARPKPYPSTVYPPTVVTPVVAAVPVAVPVIVPFSLFQFVAQPSVYAAAPVAANQPAAQAPMPTMPAMPAMPTGLEARLIAIEQSLARIAPWPINTSAVLADGGPPLIRDGQTAIAPAPRPVVDIGLVAGVLQKHCAQCHSGRSSRGDVVLFDDSGAFRPNQTPEEIWVSVRKDRMPKTPAKLDPSEKSLLEAWAKGG